MKINFARWELQRRLIIFKVGSEMHTSFYKAYSEEYTPTYMTNIDSVCEGYAFLGWSTYPNATEAEWARVDRYYDKNM